MNKVNLINNKEENKSHEKAEASTSLIPIPSALSILGQDYFRWQYPEKRSLNLPKTAKIFSTDKKCPILPQSSVTVLTGKVDSLDALEEHPELRRVFYAIKTIMDFWKDKLTVANFLSRSGKVFPTGSWKAVIDQDITVNKLLKKFSEEMNNIGDRTLEQICKDSDIIEKYKVANCEEMSTLLGAKLFQTDPKLTWQLVEIENGDHMYLRAPVAKGLNILADCWSGLIALESPENQPPSFKGTVIFTEPTSGQIFHVPVIEPLNLNQKPVIVFEYRPHK